MAGETVCSFWELQSTQTFSRQSSWWWKLLKILFPATSESHVAGSRVVYEFTFCGIKVKLWRSSISRSKQRIQYFIHWYCLQGHMKSHEKESIHPIALSPNISSLEDEPKSPSILICKEKKNQIFYLLWQYKLDKNFNLTFRENSFFAIFNDCQDMLQNVDEIVSRPFPVNWVFNRRLTNFEDGFILQPFFLDYNLALESGFE